MTVAALPRRTPFDALTADWMPGLPTVRCPRCGASTHLMFWSRTDEDGTPRIRVIASCDDWTCSEAVVVS